MTFKTPEAPQIFPDQLPAWHGSGVFGEGNLDNDWSAAVPNAQPGESATDYDSADSAAQSADAASYYDAPEPQPDNLDDNKLNEFDVFNPDLAQKLSEADRAILERDWYFNKAVGRWEERETPIEQPTQQEEPQHQAVETVPPPPQYEGQKHGIVILSPSIAGGRMEVIGTDKELASEAIGLAKVLIPAYLDRPMLPAQGLSSLAGPFNAKSAPTTPEQTLVKTFVVAKSTNTHVGEEPATTPQASNPYPETSSRDPQNEKNHLEANQQRRRPGLKTVRNIAVLAIPALIWLAAGDRYVEHWEEAAGQKHSLHIISKIVPR
jgi:hypothetical protein